MKINKFVIITQPRSGSNMLVNFLDIQKKIVCHYEIFNPKKPYYSFKTPELEKLKINKFRFKFPRIYLKLLSIYSSKKNMFFGFKFFINSINNKPLSILNYVINNKNFKKIILIRKNIIRNYISLKNANMSDRWSNLKTSVKINIDTKDFLNFAENYENYFTSLILKLKEGNQDFHIVYYEDLDSIEYMKFYNEIAIFLGLDFFEDVSKKIFFNKQRVGSLEDSIENFKEFKNDVIQTRYSIFLDL